MDSFELRTGKGGATPQREVFPGKRCQGQHYGIYQAARQFLSTSLATAEALPESKLSPKIRQTASGAPLRSISRTRTSERQVRKCHHARVMPVFTTVESWRKLVSWPNHSNSCVANQRHPTGGNNFNSMILVLKIEMYECVGISHGPPIFPSVSSKISFSPASGLDRALNAVQDRLEAYLDIGWFVVVFRS